MNSKVKNRVMSLFQKGFIPLIKGSIVVVIALALTLFVACGKDEDNGSGILNVEEKRLVGNWYVLSGIVSSPNSVYWNEYAFYSNGTFYGFRLYRPYIEDWDKVEPRKVGEGFIEGKWSCSDGKVYITDFYRYVSDTEKEKDNDKTLEYSIFNKENGETYLRMHYVGIRWDTDYLKLPPGTSWDFVKTAKSNIIVPVK